MSEGLSAVLLAGIRRHERLLALVWLVAVGLVGMSVLVGPIRARVLDGAQKSVVWWEGRWSERLREGERLVAEKRWEEAVSYLERLDRIHPARNVRHKRDRERERVLRLLARSYEALDRRARTIETYQRLVAFDPNHYRNHFDLAQASERLLSRGTMAPEARDAYAAALDIFPAYLPSVRGYTRYYLDRGESGEVVASYQRYLDAYLVQDAHVSFGDAVVDFPVVVDGRYRDYEIPAITVWSAGDVLTIATGGFAAGVEAVEVLPAMQVGVAQRDDVVSVDLAHAGLVDFEPVDAHVYQPLGVGSALVLPVSNGVSAVRGVRLRVALFKPVDPDLWAVVSKSFRNRLDEVGLVRAKRRTVVLESRAAADLVTERLTWALEGLTTRTLGPDKALEQLLSSRDPNPEP